MATYTPSIGPGAGLDLDFHLLIDPPQRETRQTLSERIVPGGDTAIVDRIGKSVTRIRGSARFDSFEALKTFEGVVGTSGTLFYSEEPEGLTVEFVSLNRTRVTPFDIHLASVEFWIIPPTVEGLPTIVRPVSVSATTASGAIPNILSARVSFGFDQRTGECRLVTPIKPDCTYDAEITVVMGAGGLDGTVEPIVRFVGLVRDFQYQAGSPTVTTVAHGYLIRAIEYENGDDTNFDPWTGHSGLFLQDLLGGAMAGPSTDIVKQVLTIAGVPFDDGNILGSSVQYGTAGGVSAPAFMWHAGGSGVNAVPMPQEQGETAMSYIERYDTIDAELDGPNTGGRYRTFESLGGVIFRVRVGGRPQATEDFTLTEGIDILGGNFTRSISQTRNRFVVKGMDRGEGFGPLSFLIESANDFQPAGTKHTYTLSSDMIERADNSPSAYQAADGMSCETLAAALQLEYNREIVSGWVETWRDDAFGIAQTHLVQGGPGGTVGALGLAEKVWVQNLELSVDTRGFTQRLTYLGGGLPEGETADLRLLHAGVAAVAVPA
jgi:hypothetical protein